MRNVFWDTMLFLYLLEENAKYFSLVQDLLYRFRLRGDRLFTSTLALGEIFAGISTEKSSSHHRKVEAALQAMRFEILPFDERCIPIFSTLRGTRKAKTADAIHLACAGAAQMDLFLTNDQALCQLVVPGIKFIAGFDSGLI